MKSLEPSLLTAQDLIHHLTKGDVRPLPEQVIILDQPVQVERLKETVGATIHYQAGLKCAFLPSTGKERIAAVASLGMGGPAMAMVLELLQALGARNIIHLGTAGSLTAALQPGDVIVVDGAFDDDGTARHYGQSESFVKAKAVEIWPLHLSGLGMPTQKVSVWTTAAPFRETKSKVEQFVAMGAEAVEMEAATALFVGNHLGLRVECIRVISDKVLTSGWQPHFKDTAVKRARENVLDVLLQGNWP